MMKHDPAMIRDIQLENLKSLKKLDEICKKYDIAYWVAYGTLIGTIRHDGFVPWDDDVDVGMMWSDFQKLCAVPAEEWGDDCVFLYGTSSDMRHDKLFGRVYQKNSVVQSYTDVEHWLNPETGESWSTSCMCDIFIYDFIPDDPAQHQKIYDTMVRQAKKYKLTKLKTCYTERSLKGYLKKFVKGIYWKLVHLLHKRPWEHYYAQCRDIIEQYPHGNRICSYYAIDPSVNDYGDIFPLREHTYEDMTVPIPQNYDKVLRDFYGDYMQFPPEDQRYHIDFVYVKLGSGKEYILDPIPGSLGAKKRK